MFTVRWLPAWGLKSFKCFLLSCLQRGPERQHPRVTHRTSRQSSTLAWGPAWPGRGRPPAGRRAWRWQSRRWWSGPPAAACTATGRWPATRRRCTAWRWRRSRGRREGVALVIVCLSVCVSVFVCETPSSRKRRDHPHLCFSDWRSTQDLESLATTIKWKKNFTQFHSSGYEISQPSV